MSNKITYNKLVRDKIPQVIEVTGKEYKTHIATDEEYKDLLLNKLLEETTELRIDPCVEEVADVLEVIEAIVKLYDFDMGEINKIKESKHDKRGGFDDRIVLEYVVEEKM